MSSSSSSSYHPSSSSAGPGWILSDEDDQSDDDNDSTNGDGIGALISDIACAEGGDNNWNDLLCGSCCTTGGDEQQHDDTVEEVEFDDVEDAAPVFEGQTLNLVEKNASKRRRVVKKVSVRTTQGAPKVLSPSDVAKLYRNLRYNQAAQNHCCARAKTRSMNCFEFAFTNQATQIENVAGGTAFLTGYREETLNMTRSEKKCLVQGRLRGLWNAALIARLPGDSKIPQYFPYGAMLLRSESITLCQNSFAALYDVKPNLVKNIVTHIMAANADANPEKKHDYGNRTFFDHVSYDDIKRIFEDEGNILIGTTR